MAHQFIDFFLRTRHRHRQFGLHRLRALLRASLRQRLTSADYGYDFPTFNPYPDGSFRQMYQYGSDQPPIGGSSPSSIARKQLDKAHKRPGFRGFCLYE
ncbi:MAG: hypothetical protein MZU97_04100 [Bacillus subtilis]|nr:hypothetical protein [Bacillus subtilis]